MENLSENDDEAHSCNSLKSKILKTPEELEQFNKFYTSKNDTVPIPFQYLYLADKVKVFIDEEGTWVAGYVINSTNNLRYLDPFDNLVRNTIYRDKNIKEGESSEITCIKIEQSLTKKDKMARLRIYAEAVNDAHETKKKYILGGSKIFMVWKVFEQILPNTLYFGLVPFEGGMEMGKIVYNEAQASKEAMDEYLKGAA